MIGETPPWLGPPDHLEALALLDSLGEVPSWLDLVAGAGDPPRATQDKL